MRTRLSVILSLLALVPAVAWAQTTPVEGLRDNSPAVHALTGARVVVSPGNVLENATVVIRDGVIEAVGENVSPPADARVWDLRGRTLYPGFIDPYAGVGMPEELPGEDDEDAQVPGAVHWNSQVRAFVDAAADFQPDESGSGALRAQGFTAAMAVPQLGMFRGRTAAVSLGNGPIGERMIRSGIAQAAQLESDRRVGGGYPSSAMGGIAFIRQTLYDAEWYAQARMAYERNPRGLRRPELNTALAALAPVVRGEQPLLFETEDEEEIFRALRFTEEFDIAPWIRGSGQEYRALDAIAGIDAPLILPVAFPDAPDVDRPEDALDVELEDLRHWYLAPENPARLAGAGVEFSFTADGLDNAREFLPNVRRAVQRGLSTDAALAALTVNPARLLGIESTHGTIETGKAANVIVVDGDLFADGSTIVDVWVDGDRFAINDPPDVDPRGDWIVTSSDAASGLNGRLTIDGSPARLTGSFSANGRDIQLSSSSLGDEARRLRVAFSGDALGHDGMVRLSATISGNALYGWAELPDGQTVNWRGERSGQVADAGRFGFADNGDNGNSLPAITLPERRPSMEYGRASMPEQPAVLLVRNATIWTQGPDGIIEGADMLVREGRIERVGRDLDAPSDAVVVDAQGKHVTPGMIDAHLHAGVSGGVNEGGGAIVPEVRIGDVLTANNIWTYRHLAGGLTSAHVMHGSANPIGGQNALVKMRWGALPEDLKIDGAPRTVKFALGENPKRRSGRYPDTRMGTHQIIRDRFKAALDYRRAWEEWERTGEGIPPRRDLRLEALSDILNEDILVMSHGYRQDEFLALVRLAEEFGFSIRAIHHGVEAYKIAPELAASGVGAVVWSDWGSFKIEAYDATTYNARVLTDAGVLTSLHSDNSQIAARMNWEAAKMLRTGMAPEDALALVTINTARILGIDDRVGSLEPGKDADFVIWSASPLSSTTRPEQTWVDGRKYFDLEEDQRMREDVERERAQLIQLVLEQR